MMLHDIPCTNQQSIKKHRLCKFVEMNETILRLLYSSHTTVTHQQRHQQQSNPEDDGDKSCRNDNSFSQYQRRCCSEYKNYNWCDNRRVDNSRNCCYDSRKRRRCHDGTISMTSVESTVIPELSETSNTHVCDRRRKRQGYCTIQSIKSSLSSPLLIVVFLCCCWTFVKASDRNNNIKQQQQREIQIVLQPQFYSSEDPEIDVTPAPMMIVPPTRSPTTQSPITPQPVTAQPITAQPVTVQPTTLAPFTAAPISTAPTTAAPITPSPISMTPTLLPSNEPTIVTTTLEPSIIPSLLPSIMPSVAPVSDAPTTLAPMTMSPSQLPSILPTAIRQFVNVTVPIAFAVDVQIQKDQVEGDNEDEQIQQVLTRLEEIWEKSLYNYYSGAFAERPGIRPTNVDLTLSTLQQPSQRNRRQQQRRGISLGNVHRTTQEQQDGASSTTTTIQAVGGFNAAVDELSVDPDGFVERATEELPSVITAEQLQQSINDAGGSDVVTVVSEISTIPMITRSPSQSPTALQPSDDDNNSIENRSPSKKPSTAEIVVGFTILLLTIASLLFWAHILYNKRKEHLRKRRIESLRKMQSLTYPSTSFDQSSLPPTANAAIAPPIVRSSQPQPSSSLNRSITLLPTAAGIPKVDTEEDGTTGDDDEEKTSSQEDSMDAFAQELQRAASYDRVKWEEMEQNKKRGIGKQSTAENTTHSSFANVSVHDVPNEDGVGIEVQPRMITGSFPYGDENLNINNNNNPSTPPMRLSTKNAVPWTVAGISLAPFAQRQNKSDSKMQQRKPESALSTSFSPYGDRNTGRSLRESWDLDEFPVKDENGPSQFSFLHPLRRQDVNGENIPDARRSPDSEMSVREDSLEVTSIGTPDYTTNAVIREVAGNSGNIVSNDDDESDDVSQSVITASMMKELDDIANYVKQYEEQKRSRVMSVPPDLPLKADKKQPASSKELTTSRIPSQYSVQSSAADIGNTRFVKSRSGETTSLGLSDDENDDEISIMSQRLGISRFSVERPGAPLLTYKTSQEDPLEWEMNTADLSPFPSSDIDSLRYSPSQSFEKQQQQMTNNFAKESLLDGALQRNQTSMSDESDVVPYYVSTNRDKSDADNGPTKANDMLGYLKRSIDAGRAYIQQQQQQQKEDVDEVEERISPKVRSKDEKYNTIRSMFESKRTAPIVPPNESWQYAGSYTGTNTSSVIFDHSHSNLTSSTNHAMIGGGVKPETPTLPTKNDHTNINTDDNNNRHSMNNPGGASYGSSTFSDPFQFDL